MITTRNGGLQLPKGARRNKFRDQAFWPIIIAWLKMTDAAMISTSDPSANQTNTVEPLSHPKLMMTRKELNVWKALCALEEELEGGVFEYAERPLARTMVQPKSKMSGSDLLMDFILISKKKSRCIEKLSEPNIKAKRRHIEEKVDKLLARLGVESTTGTDSFRII
ncbi:hypothetical protein QWA68_000786 [Fusarium oxysporum]|nr:hypothetical protein QWA68_000786 [Fusarium oxysporum]